MDNYINCLENAIIYDKKIIAFDVGCNIDNGTDDFTEIFLNKYPNSICYAVEPLHWGKCKEKWKNDSRVIFIKNALSDDVEIKNLFVPIDSSSNGLSSFYNRSCFNNQVNTVRVECISLDLLFCELKLEKINYLKIDTEGSEFNILKGAKNLLKNKSVDFIQFEYGGTYDDAGYTLEDIEKYLNQFGYHFHYTSNNLSHGDIVFTNRL